MTIGLLVDGQAEYHGLPLILPRVETSARVIKPLYCDLQPFATPEQIAHVAMKNMQILIQRGATEVIVLIDRETRPECPSMLASSVSTALKSRLLSITSRIKVVVVIKVSTFENWLVADYEAFKNLPGRFRDQRCIKLAVHPNKADNINATDLLKRCAKGKDYDKVRDAKSICDKINPNRAGKNSRSFRRFLRVLGHPQYSQQSRQPV